MSESNRKHLHADPTLHCAFSRNIRQRASTVFVSHAVIYILVYKSGEVRSLKLTRPPSVLQHWNHAGDLAQHIRCTCISVECSDPALMQLWEGAECVRRKYRKETTSKIKYNIYNSDTTAFFNFRHARPSGKGWHNDISEKGSHLLSIAPPS